MKKNKRRFHGSHGANESRNGNNDMEEKINNNETGKIEEPEDAVITDEIDSTPAADTEAEGVVAEEAAEELTETEKLTAEVETLKTQLEKEKKDYMFLMADFDNYKKNALKQRTELIKNAAENVFKGLLPIVDDMERAIAHGEKTEDAAALREGMELIYKKLKKYMEQNGVKEMECVGEPFDSDLQEAVAMVPVADESQKGKVLDAVEKGYMINDKVLRHAKVAVGQ